VASGQADHQGKAKNPPGHAPHLGRRLQQLGRQPHQRQQQQRDQRCPDEAVSLLGQLIQGAYSPQPRQMSAPLTLSVTPIGAIWIRSAP